MDSQDWQRLKEAFARVIEAPPSRRGVLIDEACGDDDAMRAELQSLLASHDDTQGTLGTVVAPTDDERVDGRWFGPYQVVTELGRGGMGAVFLARRADGVFEREVAIKIVARGLLRDEMERRFQRERKILASLDHPHIARLLDGGVTPGGESYFVMEYVDGQRIDTYCRAHALATRERVRLLLSVCDAVRHAHDRQIIHRDLKPSNILVTRTGVPKLLDFGIARLLDEEGRGEATRTEYRAFTPDYAAPEQTRGDGRVTPATDVYSLGVLIARVCGGEPSLGRDASLAALDAPLQRIARKATQPQASMRYADAAALAADLQRYLAGEGLLVRGVLVERVRGLASPRRLARVAMGAVVMGALVLLWPFPLAPREAARAGVPASQRLAGGGAGTAGAVTTAGLGFPRIRTVAALPPAAVGADSDADLAALRGGLAQVVSRTLERAPDVRVRPLGTAFRPLETDLDPIEVGRALGVDAVLAGTLEPTGDAWRLRLAVFHVSTGAVVWSEQVTAGRASLLAAQERLVTRAAQLVAGSVQVPQRSLDRYRETHPDAQQAFLRGSLAMMGSRRTVADLLAARDAFEQAIRLDPEFALAHAGLAGAYASAGALTLLAPVEAYPRAERAVRRALELDPDLEDAWATLGAIEGDYNWNWDAADAAFQRALALAPGNAAIHDEYAQYLMRLGRFAEAASHSDTARAIDPNSTSLVTMRALRAYLEHRFDDAVLEAEQAISRDPRSYLAHLYLSVAQAARGDHVAGLEAARGAARLSGGHPSDIFVAGCNYALMNHRRRAHEHLDRLRAYRRRQYVDSYMLAAIHAYLGETDEAFAALDDAYRERSYWMTTLRVHPVVDSLRADPRFPALLQRMQLE